MSIKCDIVGEWQQEKWARKWVNGSPQSKSLRHTERDGDKERQREKERKGEGERERKRQGSLLAEGNQCGEMAKEKYEQTTIAKEKFAAKCG